MTFSEPIDAANASIELLDAQLRAIDGVGPVTVDDAGTVARVDLPSLEPGVYTVSYQVVSTVDGHATAGIFAFVIDPTGAQAPPASPPTSSSPSVDAWAIAARWLALLAALVGLGTLVTWWHAGHPTLEALAPSADRRPPWRLACRRFGGNLPWPGALPRALGAPDRCGGWTLARHRRAVRLDAVRDRDARVPAVRVDCGRRRTRRGSGPRPVRRARARRACRRQPGDLIGRDELCRPRVRARRSAQRSDRLAAPCCGRGMAWRPPGRLRPRRARAEGRRHRPTRCGRDAPPSRTPGAGRRPAGRADRAGKLAAGARHFPRAGRELRTATSCSSRRCS